MKQNIKILGSLLLAFGLTTAVHADPLKIVNNTDYDSTSVINKGACSSLLPGGTTRAHTTNVVSERLIKTLCGNKDCQADIYMQPNCKGPVIASVVFNVKTGLGQITTPINGFGFEKLGPFAIVIKGGPKVL